MKIDWNAPKFNLKPTYPLKDQSTIPYGWTVFRVGLSVKNVLFGNFKNSESIVKENVLNGRKLDSEINTFVGYIKNSTCRNFNTKNLSFIPEV